MKWITDAPKEKGFYWAKQWPSHPQIVEVTQNLTVSVTGHNVPVNLSEFFMWGEYPIQEPE